MARGMIVLLVVCVVVTAFLTSATAQQHTVQQHPVQQHPVQQHPVQQHLPPTAVQQTPGILERIMENYVRPIQNYDWRGMVRNFVGNMMSYINPESKEPKAGYTAQDRTAVMIEQGKENGTGLGRSTKDLHSVILLAIEKISSKEDASSSNNDSVADSKSELSANSKNVIQFPGSRVVDNGPGYESSKPLDLSVPIPEVNKGTPGTSSSIQTPESHQKQHDGNQESTRIQDETNAMQHEPSSGVLTEKLTRTQHNSAHHISYSKQSSSSARDKNLPKTKALTPTKLGLSSTYNPNIVSAVADHSWGYLGFLLIFSVISIVGALVPLYNSIPTEELLGMTKDVPMTGMALMAAMAEGDMAAATNIGMNGQGQTHKHSGLHNHASGSVFQIK